MKKITSLAIFLFLCGGLNAQIRYHDASQFPLYGKAAGQTANLYVRLPDSLEKVSRPPVWRLSRNSAGMAVRFSSDSRAIAARWTPLTGKRMDHMTDTAVRGLDLYVLDGGEWRFVKSARPGQEKECQTTIIENMTPREREYMLYLPLYDGLASLEIGVDSLSSISGPRVESPVRAKPVVFYGTSILQGGCASRPGMASTNIISRRLDRETINLGFSGNALLDLEVAEVMATVDAGCYVLDFVPNSPRERILDMTDDFYRIIRRAHPGTPVFFIENPVFPHSRYDTEIAEKIKGKNEALRMVFDGLARDGERDIYYISSEGMIGFDGEGTVDGTHFTDVGMMRYADLVCPLIRERLR